jgi:hypothetical protein
MAIREVISKYSPLPPTPVPGNNTKKAYGTVQLSFVSFLKITRVNRRVFFYLIEAIVVELYQNSFTTL